MKFSGLTSRISAAPAGRRRSRWRAVYMPPNPPPTTRTRLRPPLIRHRPHRRPEPPASATILPARPERGDRPGVRACTRAGTRRSRPLQVPPGGRRRFCPRHWGWHPWQGRGGRYCAVPWWDITEINEMATYRPRGPIYPRCAGHRVPNDYDELGNGAQRRGSEPLSKVVHLQPRSGRRPFPRSPARHGEEDCLWRHHRTPRWLRSPFREAYSDSPTWTRVEGPPRGRARRSRSSATSTTTATSSHS